jgi:hypothetical protein
LTNTVQIKGTGEGNRSAIGSATATVNVLSLVVKITSLTESQTVAREITVAGTVNDPTVTQAIISINGKSVNMPVVNGNFSMNVSLANGVNVIVVTVNKPGGISASDTVTLEPVP